MRVGLEAFVQLPRDLRVNRHAWRIAHDRQTMHCSHCSNFDSTYVLDNPIATICDDRDPCRCPCHKLLKALDLTHGRVFFELAGQRRQE